MSGWAPPDDIEEYRLVRPLGHGAMGQVYLARDVLLDRLVAVKFLVGLGAGGRRERFVTEARAAARLAHPNVVGIYRVGEWRGVPYLVSQFVPGQPLDQIGKPVPWRRALEIGVALARGLAAAHRRGVLHRDIKPANVIVSEQGDVKLVDFGLAKLVGGALEGTLEGGDPAAGPSADPDPHRTLAVDPTEPADAGTRTTATADAQRTLSLGPGEAVPPSIDTPARTPLARDGGPALRGTRMVGTPLYMAPEVWRGETASKQSDVYSLGVVLYELLTGVAPFDLPMERLREAVLHAPAPRVAEGARDADPRLCALIDRCLGKDPESRPESGEALREALEQIAAPAWDRALPEGNPYRGLQAFDADHRQVFFGRGPDTRAVVDRLRSESLVVVGGDSGVGKSSLCRAGVLPAVTEGALGDGRPWISFVIVPGRHPVTALAAALAAHVGVDEAELAARIRAEPLALARDLRRRPGRDGTLVLIDQMEELWTIADPDEATVAAEAIAGLGVRVASVRVLATVRGDFLTRLASVPALDEHLAGGLYLLPPLGPDAAREVIEGPARARDFRFESPAMVDTLAEALRRAPGALPLLQFSLAALWERRDQKRRIVPEVALAEIGGVQGALARHADGVVDALAPDEREAARRILGRLVTAEGARLRRGENEICDAGDRAGRAALNALVRGRLLVERGTAAGSATFEIGHEALLSDWATLREWLGGDAQRRVRLDRVRLAAAQWDKLGRRREWLWSDGQMAGLEETGSDLPDRERDFLSASRHVSRARRLRRIAAAVVVPLVLVLGVAGARLRARSELHALVGARVSDAESFIRRARDDDRGARAMRARALALFDDGNVVDGEAAWALAREAGQRADGAQRSATQLLEGALALDPQRASVHTLLADVLFERVLASERDGRAGETAELAGRLATHDDGSRMRRLAAPARVDIDTTPEGVTVALEEYLDRDGHKLASSRRVLGVSPVTVPALPPGSYRLLLSAPGRADVRVPFRVERGELRRVFAEVPLAQAVPPGFVFVPAGQALMGSAATEELRRDFLGTPPLHIVDTAAYLIARTELTFADWIQFLDHLPAPERARRTPRASTPRNTIELLREGAGWTLLFQSGKDAPIRAAAGEALRYPGRSRRAAQEWLRFPVSGISFDDVVAYTNWLDASGRVPGARPCDEREWERAARGADGRRYPAGDELGPDDANHDETYGRDPHTFGPDEVGSHPGDESPFGVADLSGNVWEMTRSVVGTGGVALRGGSYYHGALTCRTDNRESGERQMRDPQIGTRICASWRTASRPSQQARAEP